MAEQKSSFEPGSSSERSDSLVGRIEATIREFAMFEPGEKVLVAVSGGADSVCLVDVLHELGYALEVAHFDHQTRNGESAADAEFVRNLANAFSLPFHLESRPIEAEACGANHSFEEYARNARYEFFFRIAEARGCAVVATGHHADDQTETVLMRILRGTTPAGIAGIPPVAERHGVRIVRPLIACQREEILEYLKRRQLVYRVDRTNRDTIYPRNRVRHELLPLLERDYNPRVREALLRLAELERGDSELLDSLVEVPFEECVSGHKSIDRGCFSTLHPAVQRRILTRLAWHWGIECAFDRVQAATRFVAEGPTGRRLDLGEGVYLQNGREVTEVFGGDPADVPTHTGAPLAVPGVTAAFGKTFTVTVRRQAPQGDLAAYCSPSRQVFGAAALGSDLVVRPRQPGDVFTPLGMQGSKKLKRYLIDIGLPAWERAAQLVLVAGGRIAWVVGHAIGAEFAVTDRSVPTVEIEVGDAAQ